MAVLATSSHSYSPFSSDPTAVRLEGVLESEDAVTYKGMSKQTAVEVEVEGKSTSIAGTTCYTCTFPLNLSIWCAADADRLKNAEAGGYC